MGSAVSNADIATPCHRNPAVLIRRATEHTVRATEHTITVEVGNSGACSNLHRGVLRQGDLRRSSVGREQQ